MLYVSIGSWHYLGADGAMVKGLQASGGKWYYLDKDGKMATRPVMLKPDQDGVCGIQGWQNKTYRRVSGII